MTQAQSTIREREVTTIWGESGFLTQDSEAAFESWDKMVDDD
jgi:hypothetical protein